MRQSISLHFSNKTEQPTANPLLTVIFAIILQFLPCD